MKKTSLAICLGTSMAILLMACNTLPRKNNYTNDYRPRDGQVIWFTQEEVNLTVRLVATCISASEMATDFHRATRKYAEYLRLCYYNISQNNVDVDAGIRALNFIKKLHQDAEGSNLFWEETLKLAKSNTPKLRGKPIPQDYN